MEHIPSDKEEKKVVWKKKLAEKGVRLAEKIAKRKAKLEIKKLYTKHEDMIEELMDRFVEIVDLEPESKQPTMVAMICANAITGFDTDKEKELCIEMISETIKNYKKP